MKIIREKISEKNKNKEPSYWLVADLTKQKPGKLDLIAFSGEELWNLSEKDFHQDVSDVRTAQRLVLGSFFYALVPSHGEVRLLVRLLQLCLFLLEQPLVQ